MNHSRWRLAREKALTGEDGRSPELKELDREISLSMALAQVVYDRRKALGLSQEQLARSCGLTQAKISRIEGSDTVPTLPLLAKLAKGLNASLNIAINEEDVSLTLTARDAA
ncbi:MULTISPECIES: helix-turn-helix domain-containing protein [Streptomyces]|uniref:Helix-turn-helix transcriptional regulator n=1 Tax=Streptomyces hirsutus TaxID=35620 RepID=A0ABZ1GQM8_9ACTN|nr:helix-turn-helix transcriptional regulator [Streptomyces hirsutus]WSD07961.1 helix-turn-helix transcriptional regulator [Streptomyces hirsutus]WTD18594.1 helix-turn-helix transcriptional regulator [Streptomyces hirsutus]WTD76486.1 helix-turn-helix transcriptional regulator [Streptomyces sp. NBC_01635]